MLYRINYKIYTNDYYEEWSTFDECLMRCIWNATSCYGIVYDGDYKCYYKSKNYHRFGELYYTCDDTSWTRCYNRKSCKHLNYIHIYSKMVFYINILSKKPTLTNMIFKFLMTRDFIA